MASDPLTLTTQQQAFVNQLITYGRDNGYS